MSNELRFFGAVEAGGTKFVCAVGDETGRIHTVQQFPTADPASTIENTLSFLRRCSADFGDLSAIGIGSFGPIEINGNSPRYGFIGRTPKPGWSGVDIAGPLSREFACPIGFDTDVNTAALGEHRWGAAMGVENLVYLTIGTGIGGGVLIDGKPIHGLMHPEIGHLYPRRHPRDPVFEGVCSFHHDCMEGLASGPAIVARSGAQLQQLEAAHPQWEIEADYLGQLCAQLVLTISPQRIVMGGGVMSQLRLLPPVRERMRHWLRGYIDRAEILTDIEHYVVAPGLGAQSGVLGALVLAIDAASV